MLHNQVFLLFLKKKKIIKLILKDLRSLSFIYNSPIFLYSSVVTRRDPLFPCPLEERNALITLATISFRFYAESNCFFVFFFVLLDFQLTEIVLGLEDSTDRTPVSNISSRQDNRPNKFQCNVCNCLLHGTKAD